MGALSRPPRKEKHPRLFSIGAVVYLDSPPLRCSSQTLTKLRGTPFSTCLPSPSNPPPPLADRHLPFQTPSPSPISSCRAITSKRRLDGPPPRTPPIDFCFRSPSLLSAFPHTPSGCSCQTLCLPAFLCFPSAAVDICAALSFSFPAFSLFDPRLTS